MVGVDYGAAERAKLIDEEVEAKDFERAESERAQSIYGQPQDQLEVLRHYSTVGNNVPKQVREDNWAVFSKELPMTFMGENDLPLINLYGQILRLNNVMTKPPKNITWHEINNFNQTDLYLFLQTKRAIGSNDGRFNERRAQITQINQRMSTSLIDNPKRGGVRGWIDNNFR